MLVNAESLHCPSPDWSVEAQIVARTLFTLTNQWRWNDIKGHITRFMPQRRFAFIAWCFLSEVVLAAQSPTFTHADFFFTISRVRGLSSCSKRWYNLMCLLHSTRNLKKSLWDRHAVGEINCRKYFLLFSLCPAVFHNVWYCWIGTASHLFLLFLFWMFGVCVCSAVVCI